MITITINDELYKNAERAAKLNNVSLHNYNAEVKKIMTEAQYMQFTEDQQRHGRSGNQNENK